MSNVIDNRQIQKIYIVDNFEVKLTIFGDLNVEYISRREICLDAGCIYLVDLKDEGLLKYCLEHEVFFDFIQNWTCSWIDIENLRKIGCFDYTDIYGNRIIYCSRTPNCRVIRTISRGRVVSNNSLVRLGNFKRIIGDINIYVSGKRSYVRIGHGTTIKGLNIVCAPRANVIVGNDVQMARNIELRSDDAHLIFDVSTKRAINSDNNNIYVGNHVWLGVDVVLLGGAYIADGCVVGMRSLTSRSFAHAKNCIIAGAPAKIIRENIMWSRDCLYSENQTFDKCIDKEALKYLEESI